MNNGVYTAASGLMVAQSRLDIISHNLANVSTSGYRAQRPFARVLQSLATGEPGTHQAASRSVALAGTYEVPGRGVLRETGRNLDVALPDGTFLTVQTEAGRRFTRGGELNVTPDGYLADATNNRVLDAAGKPIKGLLETSRIEANGAVFSDLQEIGRLGLVRDPLDLLARDGSGLFNAAGRETELEKVIDPALQPGWLEGSGTDALREMVSMIEAQRAFESLQKLITLTMHEVDRRAVNDLAG